ncbi:GNAT family N-acetyltransferase [Catalinimonas niigatensis]|uniref:GNAT family N-acetyltransferase n=1 Tax=Catalinimonas niigatensis TaxID=1397264 RepID=UPI0026664019|nr:GNAT family N-acetyltransferase [Catalinimonas niigatensis]WPP50695.1 GNAT family N-acetyltransferase [Catalinimonas niigatensis]
MLSIEIKKLETHDIDQFIALIRVFEDVFEMKAFLMPERHYLQQLLAKDDFFVFVALSEGNVLGGLTSYTLQQYYSTSPLVYIYDLAVQTDFQRKGIGKKLISAITKYCKEMDMEEVFVQADEVDDYALDFYRSTGATSEKVVHFYYPLNKS